MSYKIAYSIKKYNQNTKRKSFYKDVEDIFSQKILYKIDNFLIDLEMENEIKINFGLDKFHKVYGKKNSSLSNQNFILTFSILNEDFFKKINLELFKNSLYNILNSRFDILSFVITKDNIDDITFYVICTATVKNIFLDHIITRAVESGKNIEDLIGVLSYNLILGGTINEKPEYKFISLLLKELNASGEYNLSVATKSEKQNYILDSYNRASSKIQNIYKDYDALIEHLDAKTKATIDNIINKYDLTTLK